MDVEQAIRMGDHGSVTKAFWKETWWSWDVLLRKKTTLNIKSSDSLSVITLRKHIQIKGWDIIHCFRTIFSQLFGKLSLFVKSLFPIYPHWPSRGIESILIGIFKKLTFSLKLHEVPPEWITLTFWASVLNMEGKEYIVSGFRVFLPLAVEATSHHQKAHT